MNNATNMANVSYDVDIVDLIGDTEGLMFIKGISDRRANEVVVRQNGCKPIHSFFRTLNKCCVECDTPAAFFNVGSYRGTTYVMAPNVVWGRKWGDSKHGFEVTCKECMDKMYRLHELSTNYDTTVSSLTE